MLQFYNLWNFYVKKKIINFILLISFASIGAVIPSSTLIEISQSFNINEGEVDSVVNIFIFGYAISQILYAYLGSKINRINVIYLGTSIATIGFVIDIFSYEFNFFLFGRLLAGIGSGCGLAVTFGLIYDYYPKPEEAKKISAYTTSAFAIMPGASVILGSVINTYLGWKYINIFMVLYCFLIFYIAYLLPNDKSDRLIVKHTLIDTLSDFKKYIIPALIWGLCGAIIYMFSSHLSIISISEFQYTSLEFGLIYGFTMVGYFLGNLLVGIMTPIYDNKRILYIGGIINIISACGFMMISQLLNNSLFFIPVFFIYLSFPLLFSPLIGQAMLDVENRTIASGMMGFICMSLSALIAYGASNIMGGNPDLVSESQITFLICFFTIILTYKYIRTRYHSNF